MVTLRFNYAEIIDTDWTAVTIEILQDAQLTHAFRNYVPDQVEKEICSNQTETFQLPDLAAALFMVQSNPNYHAFDVEVLAN